MIDILGLNDCADTFIGSPMLRGISGGEKKRTSIGCELISDPKILFLKDEEILQASKKYLDLETTNITEFLKNVNKGNI